MGAQLSPSCPGTATQRTPRSSSKGNTMGWLQVPIGKGGGKGFGAKGGSFGGKGKVKGGFGGGYSPPMQSWGKSFGKSSGKGFGKDKGKGKGKFTCPHNCKVWIGGMPEVETVDREVNKALQEHMKQAGDCKFVSMGKSGSGAAAFTSPEEAQNAIDTLNGSEFQGYMLEIDTWTKKDGTPYD